MAINIIIKAGVSVFATGLMSLLFMPVMYDLSYAHGYWDSAPVEQLIIRDNLYGMFLIMPAFLIGAIILWAYSASTRQGQQF